MSGRRKDIKVNVLLDQYLRKSKDLDAHLNELQSEIAAHLTRVDKRHQLQDRLTELSDLITDKESSVDGLRERYYDASFRQDEDALTAIQHQRTSLLADIEDYKQDIADTKAELDSVVIDGAAIAELEATLKAGITIPQFGKLITTIENELNVLATNQADRLRELKSALPSQFKDQATYDAAMKALDSSYRTSDEVKQAAQRRQAAIEEERRRFNQHQPKSSDEIRRQKDSAFAAANRAPVPAHEW